MTGMNDEAKKNIPLFGSWKQWYVFVILFLIVLIILFTFFTKHFA